MNEFEKIKTYFDICEAALKVYKWTYEINDYVIDKEKIKNLDESDYTYKPLQIVEIKSNYIILSEPSDIDFYWNDDSIFSNILNIENMGKQEINSKITSKILKLSFEELQEKYLLNINFSNIIAELNNEKLLKNNIFFKLYEYLEYSSYTQFSKHPEDAYSFYSLLILFFLDFKNYQYDFKNKKFIEKQTQKNTIKDIII